MQSLFTGDLGRIPDDYYFVYNTKGSKLYYSKLTGKQIPKKNINKNIIEKIQEKEKDLDVLQLVDQKNKYLNDIKVLQDKIIVLQGKISVIDKKIQDVGEEKIKECQIKQKQEEQEIKRRKEQYKRDQDEKFRKLFEFLEKNRSEPKKETPKPEPSKKEPILTHLQKYRITSREEWRKWLLLNHPDKGGDVNLCQEIVREGRANGW